MTAAQAKPQIAGPDQFSAPTGSEALSDRAGASQVRARSAERRKAPQNDDNQRQGSALAQQHSTL
jgi:hypothetical protein